MLNSKSRDFELTIEKNLIENQSFNHPPIFSSFCINIPLDDFLGSDLEEHPKDTLYEQAVSIVIASRNASTTFLQRKLKIGYARAASLMDELEARGVVGPQEGSRPRKVYMTGQSLSLDPELALEDD